MIDRLSKYDSSLEPVKTKNTNLIEKMYDLIENGENIPFPSDELFSLYGSLSNNENMYKHDVLYCIILENLDETIFLLKNLTNEKIRPDVLKKSKFYKLLNMDNILDEKIDKDYYIETVSFLPLKFGNFLNYAISKNYIFTVKYLIKKQKKNANIGHLYIACKKSSVDLLEYLLEEIYKNSNISKEDINFNELIFVANHNGNYEIVSYIDRKYKEQLNFDRLLLFYESCFLDNTNLFKYHYDIIKKIFKKQCMKNIRINGFIEAIKRKYVNSNILNFLYEEELKFKKIEIKYPEQLKYISENGLFYDIEELLLFSIKDENIQLLIFILSNKTLFKINIQSYHFENISDDIILVLIENGYKFKSKQKDNFSHKIVKKYNLNITPVFYLNLIKFGNSSLLNEIPQNFLTENFIKDGLLQSCKYENESFKILAEKNYNFVSSVHLIEACENKNLSLIKYLLSLKKLFENIDIDINYKNGNPLLICTKKKSYDCVKFLLENGANIGIKKCINVCNRNSDIYDILNKFNSKFGYLKRKKNKLYKNKRSFYDDYDEYDEYYT